MGNEKISQLPPGGTAQPTDLIPLARSGANVSLPVSAVNQIIATSPDGSVTVSGSGTNALALAIAAAFQGAFNVLPGKYTYAGLPAAAANVNVYAATNDGTGPVYSNGVFWEILFNQTQGVIAISIGSPLTPAQQSVAYTQPLTATGGIGMLTWSLVSKYGAANNWVITPGTTNLTGTPSTVTTDTLTIQVSDQTGAFAQKTVTIQTLASLTPAATPTFSPVAGTYSGTQLVTISDSTPSSTIYYTTNGSTPTTGSTVYTTPVSVATSLTLKAIATAPGFTQSAVGSAAYVINVVVNPQGINFPAGGGPVLNYEEAPTWINRVREGYFTVTSPFSGTIASLNAQGWPDGTQATIGIDLNEASLAQSWMTASGGVFQCGFIGSGAETIAGTGFTISNIVRGTGGSYTTFTATYVAGNFNLGLTIGNITTPTTNWFVALPGNTMTAVDDPTNPNAFMAQFKSTYGQFSYIRWMWASGVWYNISQMTSATMHTPSNTQNYKGFFQSQTQEGYPIAWMVGACLAANTGGWFNFPIWEDGPNGGAGTWTTAALIVLRSMVTAGLKVIIEIGNENWNAGAGKTFAKVNSLATTAGLSTAQYMGYRLHQLAQACRADSVIGPVFGTQVRLVLAWQAGNMIGFVDQALGYISTTYYGGSAQTDVQLTAMSIYTVEAGGTGLVPAQIGTTNKNIAGVSVSQITGITQANPCVVTFNLTGNAFAVGDVVTCSGVVGMTQLNGLTPTVSAVGGSTGAYTVSLNVNSSAFTAFGVALSGVAITGTGGQFSCSATTLAVGDTVAISGTFGGTGSITGYTNPTTYWVSATNGTTTFTLRPLSGANLTTTAGTPTGLTYTHLGGFVDDNIATIESKMLVASGVRPTATQCENNAIMAMHYSAQFAAYESAENILASNDVNLSNIGAAIMDSGWQAVVAAHKQANYNSAVSLDMHFTGGVSPHTGANNPVWEFTTTYANQATSPTLLAIQQFTGGATITRNVVNAPGAGPYVISGGNHADTLAGANPTLSGTGVAPYPSASGYQAWEIYSTTGGTYQFTVQTTGSGTTNVEVGNNGFTIPFSAQALPITVAVAVTLAKGWNYIALGNGTTQGGVTINSLTLT